MSTLDGRHALITGGGTGIGAEIARRLSALGASITLVGRRPEPIAAIAAELTGGGGNALAVPADVTDEVAVEAVFDQAAAAFGVVHILVNNAGGAESAPIGRTELALWDSMIGVNATGAFLCARAFMRRARGIDYGRVITVSSTAGLKGYGYVTAYCAAKHAAIGLTRALALEVARTPITVNAVCPGFTDTALVARSIDNIVATTARSPEEARAELERTNPQGRLVTPAEVADAVTWLAQPGASAVNGATVAVAGGEI